MHKKIYDILPDQMNAWDRLVSEIRTVLESTSYQKMTSSLVEKEEVFSKAVLSALNIGDKNDLFVLKKRKRDSLIMFAPGPVPLLRVALEEAEISAEDPLKLYQYGLALVDEDNDDKTELRQLHVFKVETIGDTTPIRDAEMILTAYRLLSGLGVDNLMVNINSLGSTECRDAYYTEICSRVGKRHPHICQKFKADPIRLFSELQSRETEMNIPLPQIVDYLHPAMAENLSAVLEFLDTLEVPYAMDPTLRGAYGFSEGTYFEIMSMDNPHIVLVRGGRHDELLHALGGKKEHGSVGMEIYADTILQNIWKEEPSSSKLAKPQVFIASIGREGQKNALKILSLMQQQGVDVIDGFGIRSLRQQLSKAKQHNVPLTIIIGRQEALEGTAILRDRSSDNQETVPVDKLFEIVRKKLEEVKQQDS